MSPNGVIFDVVWVAQTAGAEHDAGPWQPAMEAQGVIFGYMVMDTAKVSAVLEARMGATKAQVNFDAPAILRKWASRNNQRYVEGGGPYLLVDGTLDECIREIMAKPASVRHLYEIHTSPQPPLVSAVLSGEYVVELARLRDFL